MTVATAATTINSNINININKVSHISINKRRKNPSSMSHPMRIDES
jgi:hypothetical protein